MPDIQPAVEEVLWDIPQGLHKPLNTSIMVVHQASGHVIHAEF